MKIKSQIITEASGSMGGLTASHNRGGLYFRARTIPVNPGSPQQVEIRAFMAQLTSLWLNVLTSTQRSGWDTYAENVQLPDTLGEARNTGGIGMYVRSNSPRLQAGLARIDDAPTIFNIGEYFPTSLPTASVATQLLTIPFSVADAWPAEDGAGMIFWVSRPQNPSINYFKGPYRFADVALGDSAVPRTSPEDVPAPFPFVVGQRLFYRVNVSRADGRLSAETRNFAVAAA